MRPPSELTNMLIEKIPDEWDEIHIRIEWHDLWLVAMESFDRGFYALMGDDVFCSRFANGEHDESYDVTMRYDDNFPESVIEAARDWLFP